ncbi:ceramidase domain-containing protein [Aureimonas sp. SK2]|uniref:ceramidase domain-containing protein n=1 Tax=Aureimonas sp. SK2 TaxID=3015992 RepID=UPI0024439A74|nr:ceramidase domain-containing protein [Aureimonas sp. SK2]
MDWFAPIDAYCERLGPGLWAEPVNALTNAAFIAGAAYAFAEWRRHPKRDGITLAFILLVAVIGTGSLLFHTFANGWSLLADVLPIAVFIYGFFALALFRFLGLRPALAIVGTIGFAVLAQGVERLAGPWLGSSASYLPALLALGGIGTMLAMRCHGAGRWLLAAAAVFTLSLTLRTLDGPLCPRLGLGTHFLWHMLNAATLTLCLLAAIRFPPDSAGVRPAHGEGSPARRA